MPKTSQEVADRMPTPYPIGSGTNNRKLIDAYHAGWIGPLFDDLDDIAEGTHVVNMTGEALDRWATSLLGLSRRVGEGDPDYLIRIKGEVRRRIGGSTHTDIIEFVNLVIGGEAGAGDIAIYENGEDTSEYAAATYRVVVNTSLLLTLGIDTADIPDTLENIEDILNETAAAGVRAIVSLQGDSNWGTDIYDDPEALWGS